MALLGARLVRGRVVMDASWLAVSVGTATLCLLLIVRSRFSRPIKQRLGIVWAVVVIASLIGLDQAFPGIQRSAAVRSVVKLGGNVSQNADGAIVVDLSDSRCDDRSLKVILPRLKYFGNVAEIRISKTAVTDAGLDSIGKTFQGTTILRQLDVTETAVTASGLDRIKRILGSLIVTQ